MQGQVTREGASLTDRATHTQAPTHELDKLPTDREAESGSTEAARRRRVGLAERLEDMFELLVRNADPRVGHIDA